MAKALVACETSGIMRRALLALGHDVWSCDLAPAEDRTNRHIICEVRDGILNEGWDLLAVMHPPSTCLCPSGRRWMSHSGKWTHPKKLPEGRRGGHWTGESRARCSMTPLTLKREKRDA